MHVACASIISALEDIFKLACRQGRSEKNYSQNTTNPKLLVLSIRSSCVHGVLFARQAACGFPPSQFHASWSGVRESSLRSGFEPAHGLGYDPSWAGPSAKTITNHRSALPKQRLKRKNALSAPSFVANTKLPRTWDPTHPAAQLPWAYQRCFAWLKQSK